MSEILSPAGNLACAEAAIDNGADAIYLGLDAFSARMGAENFDTEALQEVILRAHLRGVKVYVAMNTLVKDSETEQFFGAFVSAWNSGADAVILQDPFLGKRMHEAYPDVVLHLSTQAGVCNTNGALFAKSCGFSRVILARETPLREIEKIAKIIETEVFVQGALCTCFSGQCYFSSFVGGNSGNRGRCKQPCRKRYAYDRNGNAERSYALSLSDLCVGEKAKKLLSLGVSSLKIEGRMRRPEYVAAAVRYYRGVLDGATDTEKRLSDLKRTYNRGNYTDGLAFGQDKRLLSTAIQGHLGEKVGVVRVERGNYCVESKFRPKRGDAFKILRNGEEVGGGIFVRQEKGSFIVASKTRLKNGDSVFVTTDTAVNERLLSFSRKGVLSLSLYFAAGEKPLAVWNGGSAEGDIPLQTAQSRALTREEVTECFQKTDGLPLNVEFTEISLASALFLPKSALNAFRRKVFSAVCEAARTGERAPIAVTSFSETPTKGTFSGIQKTAVVADDFSDISVDIAVYKPTDYTQPPPPEFYAAAKEKYIYYPAFATESDTAQIALWLAKGEIDGIYAENYGGVAFAQRHGCRLFAGTGWNISNRYATEALQKLPCLAYYAVSKELTAAEIGALRSEKAFALSSGNIKLMDLCYCPFGKTCARCDKRARYTLTDENGRTFPVRRYTAADGSCRFEVYNCASLVGKGVAHTGRLLDVSVTRDKRGAIAAATDEREQKKIYENHTSGHYERGVL